MNIEPQYLDINGLRRLRNVLDGRCKCVIVEREFIDRDYRDTFSHFHSKRFVTPPSRCIRLHFFSEVVDEESIASGKEGPQKAYLGYSIVRPTKPNCVGRTLLAHTLRYDKTAHLSISEEFSHLFGRRLSVEGFPFISQDGDATVCAQSSLWMLLRYYSNRYRHYSEILPFQITNLANSHAFGHRVYPSGGLTTSQLAEALRIQRFAPIIYSRRQFADTFDHLLYTYLESSIPLLVTVPRHVVVAYGHTSKYDLRPPNPSPRFLYSSYFNESYVISDDNRHPYQRLSRSGPVAPIESRYLWSDIQEFIVPLPERVFLPAESAQILIEQFMEDIVLPESATLQSKQLVYRLFLTSTRAFKRTLHARTMGHPHVELTYRYLAMPHFIWVCEIADFEEYARDKRILGEIIWDPTCNLYELDGWIALHFPEKMAVNHRLNGVAVRKARTFALNTHYSYPLFDSNLHTL
jgi:hypothetical protein